jgi:hypothetical protein
MAPAMIMSILKAMDTTKAMALITAMTITGITTQARLPASAACGSP